MRPSVLASVIFLLFVSPSFSQVAPQPVTSVRDPQAIAVLTQVITAAGSTTAIAAIQDYTAVGNITFYWPESAVQAPVTIRGRGLHEFRLDATLPEGVRSSVVNSTASFQKNPDGSVLQLPSENTAKITSAMFPLVAILNAIQDATVSVSDGGIVTRNGQQLRHITIQKTLPASLDPTGAFAKATIAHIFIDPQSLTIRSIEDFAFSKDHLASQAPHEIQFSNYQIANGVLVPFTIVDLIANQRIVSIVLSSFVVNSGLSDSDFN